MRKSIRISALALMSAALLGASATSASAYGDHGDDPQINICGNTAQTATDSDAAQSNDGHHPTFCQTGFGNTISNWNPDFNINTVVEVPGA